MRFGMIAIGLALMLAPAAALPYPSSVTWHLGGFMSGPYRLSVDLENGIVTEAKTPPGKFGDGAGLRTSELAVTLTRQLTQQELYALRQAAEIVWQKGAVWTFDDVPVPDAPPSPDPKKYDPDVWSRWMTAKMRALDSCNTSDALGRFEMVKNGVTKDYEFSTPCMNDNGDWLFHLMGCAAHPEREDCKRD